MDTPSSPAEASKLLELLRAPLSCLTGITTTELLGREAYNIEDEPTINVPIQTVLPSFLESDNYHSTVAAEIEVETTDALNIALDQNDSEMSPSQPQPSSTSSPGLSKQVVVPDDSQAPSIQPQPAEPEDESYSDIEFIGEFPGHGRDDKYCSEDLSLDEGDDDDDDDDDGNAEMECDSPEKIIKDTLDGILRRVCEIEEQEALLSVSSVQPANDAENTSDATEMRASCIHFIGKEKPEKPGASVDLQDNENSYDNVSEISGNDDAEDDEGQIAECQETMEDVQRAESGRSSILILPTRPTEGAPLSATAFSAGFTRANQFQGHFQHHHQVPVNNLISPYCLHPFCMFMRELLQLLPLWTQHLQIQELMKIRGSFCESQPPPEFADPPESEWAVAKIYKVDRRDGILRFPCKSCEGTVEHRSPKLRRLLNLHRLKHECTVCHRKYITKRQLRVHSMRHTKKPFACIFCDKPFLTHAELQNHINTHTGEKPFCCPICFVSFSHSSRYYTHIRMFHKRYDCEGCFYRACSAATAP